MKSSQPAAPGRLGSEASGRAMKPPRRTAAADFFVDGSGTTLRASAFIEGDLSLPSADIAIAQGVVHPQAKAPSPPEPHVDLASALLAWARIDDDRRFPIDRIRYDDRLRFRIPAADPAAIHFDLGSATPASDQVAKLAELGRALSAIIADDPEELFLVEGHTDLTGTDYGNLILADRRAEAVAMALTQSFDVPAANLVAQGYGGKHPLVRSWKPERSNRRVVLRRITMLIEPGYLLGLRGGTSAS